MALAATATIAEADNDVRNSWEELDGNAEMLEKQLERLKVGNSNTSTTNGSAKGPDQQSPNQVVLDSTHEDSLRTQYVPPEQKMTILPRPKQNSSNPKSQSHSKPKSKTAKSKSLQQREQEYAEARMRILGDVKFEEEEAAVELEATLSPAELLKLKIAEAMRGEESSNARGENKTNIPGKANGDVNQGNNPAAQNGPKRNKRSREKIKTVNPEPIRDFPVHKTDSDRIIRHPRGPDGSTGFNNYRS